jgi:hypothetical protein
MIFKNFLFASGDFFNWVWTDTAFLNKDNKSGTPTMYGTSNGRKSFDVLQSSFNSQAHQLSFKFDNIYHPRVRTTDDNADTLYFGNSSTDADSLPGFQSHGGMGVYVQTADSCASGVPE